MKQPQNGNCLGLTCLLHVALAPEAAPFIKRPVYGKGWDDILKAWQANNARRFKIGFHVCGWRKDWFIS